MDTAPSAPIAGCLHVTRLTTHALVSRTFNHLEDLRTMTLDASVLCLIHERPDEIVQLAKQRLRFGMT
jgi:hypothetical protein